MKTDARAGIPDTEGTPGKALRRRGILAAAGAVVAGIVAKQTPQPVIAANGDMMVLGSVSNAATAETGVLNSGPASPGGPAIHGFRSPGAVTVVTTTLNAGVVGQTFVADAPGVMGSSPNGSQAKGVYGISGGGHGVHGESTSGTGVHGNITSASGAANTVAVQGLNQSTGAGGFGVEGQCDNATGIGVIGASSAGVGVKGATFTGFAIIGQAVTPTNTAAAVLGSGMAGPGVQGQSTTGHGLVGTTDDGLGHAGLIGNANNAGGIGLMGIAPGYGTQSVGNAGVFYGNVAIHGIFDAPQMRAVVKHQGDGTYRALHTLTTPEGWVEDFGTGTLAADKADIILDHDFVALVDPGTLHVFLTPHGPQHLHVAQQSAAGFTVIATPVGGAGGPKRAEGTGTFAWRVVGKRKDIATGRLAKVAAPTAPKAPASFTIPETPVVTAPEVKVSSEVRSPTDRP